MRKARQGKAHHHAQRIFHLGGQTNEFHLFLFIENNTVYSHTWSTVVSFVLVGLDPKPNVQIEVII